MIIFCKDSRFLAVIGKKTVLSHKFLPFLAAPRTLHAANKFVLQKENRLVGRTQKPGRDFSRLGFCHSFVYLAAEHIAINSALFINDDIKEGERVIAPKVYDFGYAITAHKSQGSTFKNVLIDDVDIQTAKQSDVDLGVPSDNYDVTDPSSIMPSGKVAINDVHDMNGATELGSTPFSLGEETSSEAKPVTKSINDTISLVQQLEYVAISRATDTATIISNNVKKEGSPLHPEQSVKEDMVKFENQPTIPEQLISHLKSQGINVLNRDAMAEFLKTHKLEHLQQYINKYDLPKGELSTLSSALMTKYGNNTAYGDVIQTANYEYTVNYKGAGEFDIIEYHEIDNNINNTINDTERKGVSGTLNRLSFRDEITERQYPCNSYNVEDREANGNNAKLDKTASQGESKQAESNDGSSQNQGWSTIKRDSETGRIAFIDGDGKTISTVEDWKGIETFMTPQGEVYGFVDKDGNIYLDETKISPEHPIHEYTHLWDKTVQQKNSKLWQRGVELMKQTSLWNEILNDENYGKLWQAHHLSLLFTFSSTTVQSMLLTLIQRERATHIVGGYSCHVFHRRCIASGKVLEHKTNESTLVALTAVRHRSHVRTVGLKHDTAQWNHGWQIFSQVTALER